MTAVLPLDDAETAALAEAEQVISDGLQTFVQVGRALARIRDGRLYRQTHITFEAYCEQEFSLSRPRAYQLIDAAGIAETMSTNGGHALTSERQARELSGLDAEKVAEVVQHATETGGKITAASLRTAREHVAPKPTPVPVKVTETASTKVETYVHPQTGEVLDHIPPGYTNVNPAKVAADARREYFASPWPVFNLKLLADLKRWQDWLSLAEVGGPEGVVRSLRETPIPQTINHDAELALHALDAASNWIDDLKSALRDVTAPQLRSVQ